MPYMDLQFETAVYKFETSVYKEKDYPNGLRCMDCKTVINDGEVIIYYPVLMNVNNVMQISDETVCYACGRRRKERDMRKERDRKSYENSLGNG